MNSLSEIADVFFSVSGLAGILLIVAALIYFTHHLNHLVALTWEQREAWVRSHFPEPEYTRETIDTPQFVTALLESPEDTAIWQYYDAFEEAHKVEGGYDKLCFSDCCAKEDSEPGSLFIVAGNKVKVAVDPYEVRVLLRRVLTHKKVRHWVQEQSQYAGFTLKSVPLKDMNTVLSTTGASLWNYVFAWGNAVLIPPEKYEVLAMDHCNNINCMTFDTLFAVDTKTQCIYQPFLEVAENGEMRTAPFGQANS
jgi:hypothetical protein